MRRIHIVGRKNHGKTTLVVELVHEFCRRGIRVGTIKHSSHAHELDTPGKDSHRHRCAGGEPAAIITRDAIGVFLSRDGDCDYQRLEPLFSDCQLVLVEGAIDARGVKVEVWRAAAAAGTSCLAAVRDDIAAVISDDRPEVLVPVWPRSDVTRLADLLISLGDQRRNRASWTGRSSGTSGDSSQETNRSAAGGAFAAIDPREIILEKQLDECPGMR